MQYWELFHTVVVSSLTTFFTYHQFQPPTPAYNGPKSLICVDCHPSEPFTSPTSSGPSQPLDGMWDSLLSYLLPHPFARALVPNTFDEATALIIETLLYFLVTKHLFPILEYCGQQTLLPTLAYFGSVLASILSWLLQIGKVLLIALLVITNQTGAFMYLRLSAACSTIANWLLKVCNAVKLMALFAWLLFASLTVGLSSLLFRPQLAHHLRELRAERHPYMPGAWIWDLPSEIVLQQLPIPSGTGPSAIDRLWSIFSSLLYLIVGVLLHLAASLLQHWTNRRTKSDVGRRSGILKAAGDTQSGQPSGQAQRKKRVRFVDESECFPLSEEPESQFKPALLPEQEFLQQQQQRKWQDWRTLNNHSLRMERSRVRVVRTPRRVPKPSQQQPPAADAVKAPEAAVLPQIQAPQYPPITNGPKPTATTALSNWTSTRFLSKRRTLRGSNATSGQTSLVKSRKSAKSDTSPSCLRVLHPAASPSRVVRRSPVARSPVAKAADKHVKQTKANLELRSETVEQDSETAAICQALAAFTISERPPAPVSVPVPARLSASRPRTRRERMRAQARLAQIEDLTKQLFVAQAADASRQTEAKVQERAPEASLPAKPSPMDALVPASAQGLEPIAGPASSPHPVVEEMRQQTSTSAEVVVPSAASEGEAGNPDLTPEEVALLFDAGEDVALPPATPDELALSLSASEEPMPVTDNMEEVIPALEEVSEKAPAAAGEVSLQSVGPDGAGRIAAVGIDLQSAGPEEGAQKEPTPIIAAPEELAPPPVAAEEMDLRSDTPNPQHAPVSVAPDQMVLHSVGTHGLASFPASPQQVVFLSGASPTNDADFNMPEATAEPISVPAPAINAVEQVQTVPHEFNSAMSIVPVTAPTGADEAMADTNWSVDDEELFGRLATQIGALQVTDGEDMIVEYEDGTWNMVEIEEALAGVEQASVPHTGNQGDIVPSGTEVAVPDDSVEPSPQPDVNRGMPQQLGPAGNLPAETRPAAQASNTGNSQPSTSPDLLMAEAAPVVAPAGGNSTQQAGTPSSGQIFGPAFINYAAAATPRPSGIQQPETRPSTFTFGQTRAPNSNIFGASQPNEQTNLFRFGTAVNQTPLPAFTPNVSGQVEAMPASFQFASGPAFTASSGLALAAQQQHNTGESDPPLFGRFEVPLENIDPALRDTTAAVAPESQSQRENGTATLTAVTSSPPSPSARAPTPPVQTFRSSSRVSSDDDEPWQPWLLPPQGYAHSAFDSIDNDSLFNDFHDRGYLPGWDESVSPVDSAQSPSGYSAEVLGEDHLPAAQLSLTSSAVQPNPPSSAEPQRGDVNMTTPLEHDADDESDLYMPSRSDNSESPSGPEDRGFEAEYLASYYNYVQESLRDAGSPEPEADEAGANTYSDFDPNDPLGIEEEWEGADSFGPFDADFYDPDGLLELDEVAAEDNTALDYFDNFGSGDDAPLPEFDGLASNNPEFDDPNWFNVGAGTSAPSGPARGVSDQEALIAELFNPELFDFGPGNPPEFDGLASNNPEFDDPNFFNVQSLAPDDPGEGPSFPLPEEIAEAAERTVSLQDRGHIQGGSTAAQAAQESAQAEMAMSRRERGGFQRASAAAEEFVEQGGEGWTYAPGPRGKKRRRPMF